MIIKINGLPFVDAVNEALSKSDLIPTDDTLNVALHIVQSHPDISLFQAIEITKYLEILHHYSLM